MPNQFKSYKKEPLMLRYNPEVEKVIRRSRMGCLVQPYKPRQSYLLEQNTGQYDEVYHRYVEYVGFKVPYNGTLCYVTYNRDYDFLRRALPDYPIETAEIGYNRSMGKRLSLVGIKTFTEAQSELIASIDQSIEKKDERVWFIHLQTSGGKTLLATYYATRFNLKTMVVCFSDNILRQWEDTFHHRTNIDPNRMIRLTGRIMDRILAGKTSPYDYDVYFATPTLLDRFATARMDYKKVADFFDMAGIGYLIYDEAHRNVSSIVRMVSVTNPMYQMYLSADFGQGEYNREMQFKSIFKSVPVLEPTEQLMRSMKYTKVVVVEYNTYPNSVEKEAPFNKFGYDGTSFMRYEFRKGVIQNVIIHIINNFLKKELNHRMLILFLNIEHVETVYTDLKERFPQYDVGRYYAELPFEEKDYVKDNSDIIVATYGSFSTGLDTRNIKYVVSCNQCNKVQDNQAAGRSRPLPDGTDSIYFLLVDMGFTYCKTKLKTRLFYLQETKSKDDKAYHYIYNAAMHEDEYIKEFAEIEEAKEQERQRIAAENAAKLEEEKRERKRARDAERRRVKKLEREKAKLEKEAGKK